MNYKACLQTNKKMKLCSRGYCTVKANAKGCGWGAWAASKASRICRGELPDHTGAKFPDKEYSRKFYGERKEMTKKRPKTQDKPESMSTRNTMNPYGIKDIIIPADVRDAAKLGLELHNLNFDGGTNIGLSRARQLATDSHIDVLSLAQMRTWFARHGPDANIGSGYEPQKRGTSYPGYCKWIKDGKPKIRNSRHYRGAVAWLYWGGDAAYQWLKEPNIRQIIYNHFPKRKVASPENNLDTPL